MIEVRAYISDFELTNKKLIQAGSVIQGDYEFRDYIYQPTNVATRYDLNKEFVRIRVYHKTNWIQKSVELVHKIKSTQSMVGLTKIKKEFDKVEEAIAFLGSQYIEIFSFERKGVEHKLNNSRLFVEDIEGLPKSIEVIAYSQEDLKWIFQQVDPITILFDSIPKLIELEKEKEKVKV